MTIMLTISEQQELCQVEQDLRDTDRRFAWRLTLLQGVLRWAAADGVCRGAILMEPAAQGDGAGLP